MYVGLVFLFSWPDSLKRSLTGLILALQWEESPEALLASLSTAKWLAGDWRTLLTLYAAATGAIMGNEKRVTQ